MVSHDSACCNRQQRACHPPVGPFAMAVAIFLAGLMGASGAASAKSLIKSESGRASLLNMFSGQDGSIPSLEEDVRFRANRRHPDVGYISLDPICLSCLFTPPPAPPQDSPAPSISLPPPPAPPQDSPAPSISLPPPETFSPSPAPAPSPSPVVSAPTPSPEVAPAVAEAVPNVNSVSFERVQDPPSVEALLESEVPLSVSMEMVSSPLRQAPAPLSLLGVGSAYGFSRKVRNRIRTAQTIRT
jgi:hypothetical protein